LVGSPVPAQRASTHARVFDHAGSDGRSHSAPVHIAFRETDNVGTRNFQAFAAPWLAYALPCRRFAVILADADARLGANADCYSFIAVDFHHLLFAGFYRRTSLQDFRNSTYELDIIVIMVEIDPAACRRWLIPEDHS